MLVASWAIYLECAKLKRKITKHLPVKIRSQTNPQGTHLLEEEENTPGGEQGTGAYSLFTLGSKRPAPYKVQLSVNGQTLEMEIDTRASLSVISEKTYNNLVSKNRAPPLEKSGTVLRTYPGEEVKPKGSCTVDVCYEGGKIFKKKIFKNLNLYRTGKYSLPLLVVKEEGPALLGRNRLEEIKINWPRIKQLTSHDKRRKEILQKHAPLFGEGLGTLQGTKARVQVDPTATPMFHKARPVPYAFREKIEQDLERLQD